MATRGTASKVKNPVAVIIADPTVPDGLDWFSGRCDDLDVVTSEGALVAGQTTMILPEDAPTNTYILRGKHTGVCWVWGPNLAHYASENCIVL